MKEKFNVNTAMLAILLGLSSWSLKEIVQQGKAVAEMSVKISYLEKRVFGRAGD